MQKINAKPFYMECEQHSNKSKSTRGSGSSIGDGEDYQSAVKDFEEFIDNTPQ